MDEEGKDNAYRGFCLTVGDIKKKESVCVCVGEHIFPLSVSHLEFMHQFNLPPLHYIFIFKGH